MAGVSVVVLILFLFFIYLILFAIFILSTLINYIFESISVMCMSKSLGYKNNITSWIPFYNKYILGKISGNKIMGGISGGLTFILFFLSPYLYIYQEEKVILYIILMIIAINILILDIFIAHNIYIKSNDKYGDIFTIFNILSLGLLRPIFLFVVRNKLSKSK